uniref:Uncharacterized protein n=1 Tax=uncultured bacterium CBNPD1 BAC clone 543 TaxID=417308 RepID=B1N6I2_9BACT|nr:hypothetical protein [uncultured bacterium CBNPD1 BAC clone 543]
MPVCAASQAEPLLDDFRGQVERTLRWLQFDAHGRGALRIKRRETGTLELEARQRNIEVELIGGGAFHRCSNGAWTCEQRSRGSEVEQRRKRRSTGHRHLGAAAHGWSPEVRPLHGTAQLSRVIRCREHTRGQDGRKCSALRLDGGSERTLHLDITQRRGRSESRRARHRQHGNADGSGDEWRQILPGVDLLPRNPQRVDANLRARRLRKGDARGCKARHQTRRNRERAIDRLRRDCILVPRRACGHDCVAERASQGCATARHGSILLHHHRHARNGRLQQHRSNVVGQPRCLGDVEWRNRKTSLGTERVRLTGEQLCPSRHRLHGCHRSTPYRSIDANLHRHRMARGTHINRGRPQRQQDRVRATNRRSARCDPPLHRASVPVDGTADRERQRGAGDIHLHRQRLREPETWNHRRLHGSLHARGRQNELRATLLQTRGGVHTDGIRLQLQRPLRSIQHEDGGDGRTDVTLRIHRSREIWSERRGGQPLDPNRSRDGTRCRIEGRSSLQIDGGHGLLSRGKRNRDFSLHTHLVTQCARDNRPLQTIDHQREPLRRDCERTCLHTQVERHRVHRELAARQQTLCRTPSDAQVACALADLGVCVEIHRTSIRLQRAGAVQVRHGDCRAVSAPSHLQINANNLEYRTAERLERRVGGSRGCGHRQCGRSGPGRRTARRTSPQQPQDRERTIVGGATPNGTRQTHSHWRAQLHERPQAAIHLHIGRDSVPACARDLQSADPLRTTPRQRHLLQ